MILDNGYVYIYDTRENPLNCVLYMGESHGIYIRIKSILSWYLKIAHSENTYDIDMYNEPYLPPHQANYKVFTSIQGPCPLAKQMPDWPKSE